MDDAAAVPGRFETWARAAALARSLWDASLRAVLPPLCPGCREPLAQAGGVCAACWSKLSFIAPPYCVPRRTQ